ncbi:unnamed protein product [Leptosia nina]|uniref:Uncharacterized protein n=1 Tax=Leptosia nina TaxID=320188 RepID=A0AAV1JDA9_9NEOP
MEKYMLVLFVCLSLGSATIIIPQEFPSVSDLFLKFLPIIRKGTEQSRIGFGFAYGNHADFQTVLQFGPDRENNCPTCNTNRRRQINQKAQKKKKAVSKNVEEKGQKLKAIKEEIEQREN